MAMGGRNLESLSVDLGCESRCRLRRPRARSPPAIFAFDLLELRGRDLRTLPLLKRKARLKDVLASAKRIRYVEHVGDGVALFAAAEEAGLEGIVSKKAIAPYRSGRTGDWIKVKTTAGREIVEQRADWNSTR
jgi:ATP-dependent DNA ligase